MSAVVAASICGVASTVSSRDTAHPPPRQCDARLPHRIIAGARWSTVDDRRFATADRAHECYTTGTLGRYQALWGAIPWHGGTDANSLHADHLGRSHTDLGPAHLRD